jgi:signal transduction histidine kinase
VMVSGALTTEADTREIVAVRRPPAQDEPPVLTHLAEAVQRALASDTVTITVSEGDAEPRLAACIGVPEGEQPRLIAAVAKLIPALSRQAELHVTRLRESRAAGTDDLAAHGYRALAAASVTLDDGRLGTLVALSRSEGIVPNAELVGPFSRQVALAFARSRGHNPDTTLEERLENLEALDQVALSSRDFSDLNAAIRRRIGPLFGAAMTGVMVWDAQNETLQLTPGSFEAHAGTAASYQISASDLRSNAARVFRTGCCYLSNDAPADPGIIQAWVTAFSIRRLLSVPLAVPGRAIGVLHITNKDEDFTLDDLRRAERLAPRIATAVEYARALFDLRRKEQLEGVLSWAAVAIASGHSLLDFLPRALSELCEALDATLLAIAPHEAEPIIHRVRTGRDELARSVLQTAQSAPGVRAWAVGPQGVGDPGWATYYRPIHLGVQRIGTLAALRERAEPFAQDERQALSRLASLVALGWASERYQQQRAELARLQERQRIADDLHDDVAQILFAAHHSLELTLDREPTDPAVAEGIARARSMLARGDEAIRYVINQLSQPHAKDCSSRLTEVVCGIEEDFMMPVHLEVTEAAREIARRLSRPAAGMLLKAAREALVNAAKHAGPCRASVFLDVSRDGGLRLRVVDDGVGATGTSRNGHGLASLRRIFEAHGGSLRVRHGSAGGTTITATLPA